MDTYAQLIFPHNLNELTANYRGVNYLPLFLQKKICRILPPFSAGKIVHNNSNIVGEMIVCPILENEIIQLPKQFVREKISISIKLAEKKGARIIGLGAFVRFLGEEILEDYLNCCRNNLNFGLRYSLYIAIESAKLAAARKGQDWKKNNILLVGVDSIVGEACGRLLAREVKYMNFLHTNNLNIELITKKIMYESGLSIKVSQDVDKMMNSADIVFLLSSQWEKCIKSEMFKKGAVVISVLCPLNSVRGLKSIRPDLEVINGAIVDSPVSIKKGSIICRSWSNIYDYMVEPMILAKENEYEEFKNCKGITMAQIDKISGLANKYGFSISGLCYADGSLSL